MGRITSYALIGFVLAAVGSTVRLAGLGRGLQGILSLAAWAARHGLRQRD